MSSSVDAPVTTPRFESVSPKFTMRVPRSSERRVEIEQDALQSDERRQHFL